jgi:hypothetical protein
VKIKQYNLGKWVGIYYSQLINSLSIVGIGNSLINLTTLWAVANKSIVQFFPWLTYPILLGAIFVIVLVILPVSDYAFLYSTRQRYLNEQACKHDNPIIKKLVAMEKDLVLIKNKLNIEE